MNWNHESVQSWTTVISFLKFEYIFYTALSQFPIPAARQQPFFYNPTFFHTEGGRHSHALHCPLEYRS